LLRQGLRQVLKGLGDVTLLEAATCTRCLEVANQHDDVDLVILDYVLPDAPNGEALDLLAIQRPQLPVVVLSGHINETLLTSAKVRGAAAVLSKNTFSNELLTTIAQLVGAQPSPTHSSPTTPNYHRKTMPHLTRRQLEVLDLVTQGKTNKEIAKLIGVSDETIKNHISAIFKALGVSSRTEAAIQASHWGLVLPKT
jgi:DNA-binding NarL/FixJ family response regulator